MHTHTHTRHITHTRHVTDSGDQHQRRRAPPPPRSAADTTPAPHHLYSHSLSLKHVETPALANTNTANSQPPDPPQPAERRAHRRERQASAHYWLTGDNNVHRPPAQVDLGFMDAPHGVY
eukprot:scaffold627_cov123-Isochrysis_galbana.AAC.7